MPEPCLRRLALLLLVPALCLCLCALSACGARVEPKGQVATGIGIGR